MQLMPRTRRIMGSWMEKETLMRMAHPLVRISVSSYPKRFSYNSSKFYKSECSSSNSNNSSCSNNRC